MQLLGRLLTDRDMLPLANYVQTTHSSPGPEDPMCGNRHIGRRYAPPTQMDTSSTDLGTELSGCRRAVEGRQLRERPVARNRIVSTQGTLRYDCAPAYAISMAPLLPSLGCPPSVPIPQATWRASFA